MDQPTPDLTLQLPRDTYYQLVHTLCASLPPPVTDTPEDLARRDNAAIAQVASLLPANADEANLAVQYVATSAQAMLSLRLARDYATADHAFFLKFSALAVGMMRQARSARSLLLRVQAARQKREADNGAADKAAWTEHCAIGLMADALGRTQPAAMAEPPPPPPPSPIDETTPQPDPAAEADQYALIYPHRAALIRSLGGLPASCDFGPPSTGLVHAIVTGTSPTLRALDSPAEARVLAEA
ncbi:MAG TPA: hypothetical protein VK822_02020 [Acetobacteraceae bacterium]|jgi:hypothetical protein|nr:hypothetical protein [Acetobacteraceae bacterium]